MKMSLTLPEPLKSMTKQREFIDPDLCEILEYGEVPNWLLLRDSKSGNEVNFNLLHYGFTVLVWERSDV